MNTENNTSVGNLSIDEAIEAGVEQPPFSKMYEQSIEPMTEGGII